jgi:DnaJ-class molecular chaperone
MSVIDDFDSIHKKLKELETIKDNPNSEKPEPPTKCAKCGGSGFVIDHRNYTFKVCPDCQTIANGDLVKLRDIIEMAYRRQHLRDIYDDYIQYTLNNFKQY